MGECRNCAGVVIHEHAMVSASRERLEPERPRTGIQVEAALAGHPVLQPVEQRLAHAIAGRPNLAVRELPAAPAPAAGDDAQPPGLRAPRVGGSLCRILRARFACHGREAYRICENPPMLEEPQPQAAPAGSAPGFFGRLRARLNRGGAPLARELRGLLQGRQISPELLEELESRLIGADLGVAVT